MRHGSRAHGCPDPGGRCICKQETLKARKGHQSHLGEGKGKNKAGKWAGKEASQYWGQSFCRNQWKFLEKLP